ncbi:MAG: glycosyltransferase family 4 protein [Coprothermobacterota bacterium]|nr:glycosyltransferase family 4 protein [Coprothermobacterota bacterium]
MAEEKRLPPSGKKKWVALMYEKAIGNRILSRCRSVLAWSSDAYSFMKLRAPQGKVSLFLPGIDISLFQTDPTMRFYQNGEISLLVVARLHPYKGYDVLLQALSLLHNEGVQFRLSIVGEGDMKPGIQAEISRCSLEHLIRFLPPIPHSEMPRVYRSHDLLILPSHRDTIGMCVPEAMACGIPAIVSTGAGAKDYIIPGETGLVFPAGDARALADCIKALANESQLQRMGRNAAADIREHYSLAHQADVLYAHLTG